MGPIERELRCTVTSFSPHLVLSNRAYWIARGAATSLKLEGGLFAIYKLGLIADVLSEAIEAAEALDV